MAKAEVDLKNFGFLRAPSLLNLLGSLLSCMFEHNFGDSEFLMLFLVLVTLPYAVARKGTWPKAKESGPS